MKNGMKTSMTNISRVYYNEIDDLSIEYMGDFYFHYNHHYLTDQMRKDYEEYEELQIKRRNQIIGNAIKNNELPGHPKMDSVLFGVSSIKNKPIIIVKC